MYISNNNFLANKALCKPAAKTKIKREIGAKCQNRIEKEKLLTTSIRRNCLA